MDAGCRGLRVGERGPALWKRDSSYRSGQWQLPLATGPAVIYISRRTWRLGIHVGLSPLFRRSISSARSETAFDKSCSGVWGFGLSGIGPSQSSVRMLSSESFRDRGASVGERIRMGSECPFCLGSGAGSTCSRCSWNMGMMDASIARGAAELIQSLGEQSRQRLCDKASRELLAHDLYR